MSSAEASDAAQALERRMMAFVRAFGLHQGDVTPCGQPLSVSEAHALNELLESSPLSQQDLSLRLKLEKSTVSRLVSSLEVRGWLERSPHPRDGRSMCLHLSPSGLQVAQRLAQARRAKFSGLLKALPSGEHSAVLHALETLVEALNAHPEPA